MPAREARNAELFDGWAKSGRGKTMADGHGELVAFLLNRWHLTDDDSLLDIGCGIGLATHAALKAGAGTVAGIDVADAMIESAQKSIPQGDFRTGSAQALPWDDDSFTHILSIESLYYHSDPMKTLRDARRVLKPGGHIAIAIEFFKDNQGSASWAKALGLPMHNWSQDEWSTAFERAGCKDVTSGRIVRQQGICQPDAFEPTNYFPSLKDYETYISQGALWVAGVA